eukprot:s105_g3.t1
MEATEERPIELPKLLGRVTTGGAHGLQEMRAAQALRESRRREELERWARFADSEADRLRLWGLWAAAGGDRRGFCMLADAFEPGWRSAKPVLHCSGRDWCQCKESLTVRCCKSPWVVEVDIQCDGHAAPKPEFQARPGEASGYKGSRSSRSKSSSSVCYW